MDAQLDWSRIDHVLLDMDGTVLDLAFDNYFWGELVPQRYALANQISLEESYAVLRPRFRAIEHTLPWYCTDHWSRETGLNLKALKQEIREQVAFIGGSLEFMQAVKASGRALWLVTNAHPDAWQIKLDQVNLRPMFDVIVSSHDYGAPKEQPAFWQSLQAQHPFDPARALFADDSLPVLRSARNYGIGQIVAMRHPDSTQPPRVIDEFPSAGGLGELLPIGSDDGSS
jgi:putative hydrolase of the HAD superfamily